MTTASTLPIRKFEFRPEELEKPPEEVARFVRGLMSVDQKGAEKRASRRHAYAASVPALSLDANLQPVGAPFMVVTRNISTTGIALVHTQPIRSPHLVVELSRKDGSPIQLLVALRRCRPLGSFYDVAGEFVTKVAD